MQSVRLWKYRAKLEFRQGASAVISLLNNMRRWKAHSRSRTAAISNCNLLRITEPQTESTASGARESRGSLSPANYSCRWAIRRNTTAGQETYLLCAGERQPWKEAVEYLMLFSSATKIEPGPSDHHQLLNEHSARAAPTSTRFRAEHHKTLSGACPLAFSSQTAIRNSQK